MITTIWDKNFPQTEGTMDTPGSKISLPSTEQSEKIPLTEWIFSICLVIIQTAVKSWVSQRSRVRQRLSRTISRLWRHELQILPKSTSKNNESWSKKFNRTNLPTYKITFRALTRGNMPKNIAFRSRMTSSQILVISLRYRLQNHWKASIAQVYPGGINLFDWTAKVRTSLTWETLL